jgi:hypothetical protein
VEKASNTSPCKYSNYTLLDPSLDAFDKISKWVSALFAKLSSFAHLYSVTVSRPDWQDWVWFAHKGISQQQFFSWNVPFGSHWQHLVVKPSMTIPSDRLSHGQFLLFYWLAGLLLDCKVARFIFKGAEKRTLLILLCSQFPFIDFSLQNRVVFKSTWGREAQFLIASSIWKT